MNFQLYNRSGAPNETYKSDGETNTNLNDTMFYSIDFNHSKQDDLFRYGLLNSEKPILKDSSGSSTVLFITITGISVLCVILNCGTLGVIFQSKKIRPVNYLIANLSLVSIILAIFGVLYVGDKDHKHLHGVWLCGLLSLIRNLLIGVISLTVMGISYERVKSLKPRLEQFLVARTLLIIWAVSFIVGIPTFFTNVNNNPSEPPGCKRIPPFGLSVLVIPYELLRFAVFHVFVCCFMIFELYKVRSKLKYLYLFKTIPSERMRRKVQKVRFIYFYSITFIVVWIPIGIMISSYKSIGRSDNRTQSKKSYQAILLGMSIVLYLYYLIAPVIILWTNEDLSKVKWFWRCKYFQSGSAQAPDANIVGSSEMSRGTTFAKTSDSVRNLSNKYIPQDDPQIIVVKVPNLAESTSKVCHSVQIHVQEDPKQSQFAYPSTSCKITTIAEEEDADINKIVYV